MRRPPSPPQLGVQFRNVPRRKPPLFVLTEGNMPFLNRRCFIAIIVAISMVQLTTEARSQDQAVFEEESIERLATGLTPWIDALQLRTSHFSIEGKITLPLEGKTQTVQVRIERMGDEAFDLQLTHDEYAVEIVRTRDATALVLPKHNRVFWGHGEVDPVDNLAPTDVFKRLISSGSWVQLGANILKAGSPQDVASWLSFTTKAAFQRENNNWVVPGQFCFAFPTSTSFSLQSGGYDGRFVVKQTTADLIATENAKQSSERIAKRWPNFEIKQLPRSEIERSLARGVRRALEVLAPSPRLTSPKMADKAVENGKLMWIEGQRVVLLSGTPEQIGTAHGKLLKEETMRCIDSVLYAFGTAQTIATGRWFREELDAAYKRLSPHIPERHKTETRSLARALDLDTTLFETINVFPELFHCSGFAVMGSASVDGKLYHGRVLDYMTEIGLQDAATTFIVAPEGMNAFANIGYAGFIGSVSGMNQAQISLGEMGGQGEGQWDGVPMATLMRRALEECSTLEQVKELWRTSPRTCEYYYVFADGKSRQAVGVMATPSSIQFVVPGESHPLLGEGIRDTIVLSAGERLDLLRSRIQASHGKIDTTIGQQLMSRPVAMQSNLHNVLFVPEDGVLYVANADHSHPAADRPYVRLDLNKLLMDGTGKIGNLR